jgi:hypothetical protein
LALRRFAAPAHAAQSDGFAKAVHLNLAYCWFCQLGLEGNVADHATFLKNRHGRFVTAMLPATPRVVPLENIRWPS